MGLSDRLLDPLMKRGLPFAANFAIKHFSKSIEKRDETSDETGDDEVLNVGLAATVFTTIFFFMVFYGLVQYTLRHVVTTLALVETPAPAVALSLAQPDEESNVKLSDKEAEAEAFLGNSLPKLTVVNAKPITSKIRTTVKHITSQGGWTARWRGMGYAIVYGFVVSFLTQFIVAIIPEFSGVAVIANVLVALIAAPVHMVWTHATIAAPGQKWRARWAPATFASYKILAVPALVYEGVQLLVIYMAMCMGTLMQLDVGTSFGDADATASQKAWSAVCMVGGVLLVVAACLFVVLPAHTQLVRVEGSMLAEDEDTVIPFDRTFGGKVVPKVLGGSGAIGFMDAWRSFDREARIRVVKLYLKIFAVSTALVLFLIHVVALEAYLLGSTEDLLLVAKTHMDL